jgi:hypothetical protein
VSKGDSYPPEPLWDWARGQLPLSADTLTFMRDANPIAWAKWGDAVTGLPEQLAGAMLTNRSRNDARNREQTIIRAFDEATEDGVAREVLHGDD